MEIWRHEAGRLGRAACAAPVVAVATAVAVAVLAAGNGAGRAQVSLILLTGLEALLPLAVAMAATSVVATGRAHELHLSLPTGYATVLGRRLGLLAGATSVVAVVFSAAVWAAGLWTGPPVIASPLVWGPPVAWLAGLAVFTAFLTRSMLLATTVTAGVWLAHQMFAPAFAARAWARPLHLFPASRLDADPGWITDRLLLTVAAVPFAAGVLILLRRPERMPTEEEV
ncbi:hypothetical protein [Micromonospora sp. NPDC047074]|uniref:hypothetical protein n=1 Tax=Micromonospora sp. NPDC047074 TaxID=3154339 RepID=UPI0033E8A76B